jgi:hypothetical protein
VAVLESAESVTGSGPSGAPRAIISRRVILPALGSGWDLGCHALSSLAFDKISLARWCDSESDRFRPGCCTWPADILVSSFSPSRVALRRVVVRLPTSLRGSSRLAGRVKELERRTGALIVEMVSSWC